MNNSVISLWESDTVEVSALPLQVLLPDSISICDAALMCETADAQLYLYVHAAAATQQLMLMLQSILVGICCSCFTTTDDRCCMSYMTGCTACSATSKHSEVYLISLFTPSSHSLTMEHNNLFVNKSAHSTTTVSNIRQPCSLTVCVERSIYYAAT
jgi:hypothetical protein